MIFYYLLLVVVYFALIISNVHLVYPIVWVVTWVISWIIIGHFLNKHHLNKLKNKQKPKAAPVLTSKEIKHVLNVGEESSPQPEKKVKKHETITFDLKVDIKPIPFDPYEKKGLTQKIPPLKKAPKN